MKTHSSWTKTEFDEFLAWLDPDRDCAAETYERIRNRLISFYLNRQCGMADDLADEAINRVVKKPKEWKDRFMGNPMPYFYVVARNVFLEYRREVIRKIEPPPDTSRPELEAHLACLKKCLAKLTSESRNLILPYYQERKRAKVERHRAMESNMGLKPGALRARIFRIRTKLRECVEECLANLPQNNDINSADI